MAHSDNHIFYKASLKEYGISPLGVHWNTKESQYLRFVAIHSLLEKYQKPICIADIGCGFADFYAYLEKNNITHIKYTGIDCEEFMLDICKTRYPSLSFLLKNALEDDLPYKDFYICSGALNILTKKEFFLFIENCYRVSNKAFIFNFLSSDSYNYILKKEVLTFCENLSVKTQILEGYLENDSTILMLK